MLEMLTLYERLNDCKIDSIAILTAIANGGK